MAHVVRGHLIRGHASVVLPVFHAKILADFHARIRRSVLVELFLHSKFELDSTLHGEHTGVLTGTKYLNAADRLEFSVNALR
mgnify:CR=1 FL=1